MAGGSNVETVSATVSGSIVDILFAISTSGRQEDGWAIIMDSSYQEVLRSDYFRVYGNSSTSKSVDISSLPDGNYYAGFYSDEWGGMSPSMQPFTKGNPPLTTKTNLYGSVNNARKMVRKLYGSVNGAAKEIVALYGSVNGKATQIFPVVPYGSITYFTDSSHASSNTVYIYRSSELSQFVNSSGAGRTLTVDGETFTVDDVQKVEFTERVKQSHLGNSPLHFLRDFRSLEEVDISNTKITNIGEQALQDSGLPSYSNGFTKVALPNTLTTIGTQFLYRSGFNGDLNLPNVTSIGTNFIAQDSLFNGNITFGTSPIAIGTSFLDLCSSFNKPITLPAGTTIGNRFMARCYVFNSTLNVSGDIAAGNYFMSTCDQFNQPIGWTFTSIGDNFMEQCHNFNQPLNISAGSVGNKFMSYCSKFDSNINFVENMNKVGDDFMEHCEKFNKELYLWTAYGQGAVGNNFLYGCTNFNSNLTFRFASSVGDYFMYNCTSFDAQVRFLANVVSCGSYFMANCTSFTLNNASYVPPVPLTVGDYYMYNCSSLTGFNPGVGNSAYGSQTIGNHFMENCGNSIGTVWIGANITSIGTHFMHNTNCWNVDVGSNLPTKFPSDIYAFSGADSPHSVQVVTDTTAIFNQWLAKFPKRTTAPYRNLWESDF